MTPSEDAFARMLTEAVYSIKLRESKTIQLVQDELGIALGRRGGSAIDFWRRGHIPAEREDLNNLARAICRRAEVDRTWLQQFLGHADHPNPDPIVDQIFPVASPAPSGAPTAWLPVKRYRQLFGRVARLAEIKTALKDDRGRWIVSVDGVGGIGKTALAREVADHFLDEDHFSKVVWVSAARKESARATRRDSALDFEGVLGAVCLQLGEPGVSGLKKKEKEQRARALLRYYRTLVVLDNLETAADPQNQIAERLLPMLNPSKALLTSRRRFRGDVYAIHLTGLDRDASLRFMRQDAKEKHIKHVARATDDELNRIAYVAGGSPLAMKLVVSQLGFLPLEVVLKRLQEVTPLSDEIEEDEYALFYKSVYSWSWKLLTDDSKKLLIDMAHFAPGTGGTFEAIHGTSGLGRKAIETSIPQLWQLSLIEVHDRPEQIRKKAYYLHPLTQYFVLSDVVKMI